MYKRIFLYGLMTALLLLLLKWIDYRLFARSISMEVYVGLIAALFTGVGIWMGLKLTNPRVVVRKQMLSYDASDEQLSERGISRREYEVLSLMAQGHSNGEIAGKLYISMSTVKTHASNIYEKLDAKRRTQAIQKGKELGLLP